MAAQLAAGNSSPIAQSELHEVSWAHRVEWGGLIFLIGTAFGFALAVAVVIVTQPF